MRKILITKGKLIYAEGHRDNNKRGNCDDDVALKVDFNRHTLNPTWARPAKIKARNTFNESFSLPSCADVDLADEKQPHLRCCHMKVIIVLHQLRFLAACFIKVINFPAIFLKKT